MQLFKNKNKNLIPAGGRHLLLEGNQHSLFLVGLENLRRKFFGDQSLSVGLYTGTSPRAQLPLRQPIMPNHQAPPSSSPSVAPLTQATPWGTRVQASHLHLDLTWLCPQPSVLSLLHGFLCGLPPAASAPGLALRLTGESSDRTADIGAWACEARALSQKPAGLSLAPEREDL